VTDMSGKPATRPLHHNLPLHASSRGPD
jgi:hypothetical protein